MRCSYGLEQRRFTAHRRKSGDQSGHRATTTGHLREQDITVGDAQCLLSVSDQVLGPRDRCCGAELLHQGDGDRHSCVCRTRRLDPFSAAVHPRESRHFRGVPAYRERGAVGQMFGKSSAYWECADRHRVKHPRRTRLVRGEYCLLRSSSLCRGRSAQIHEQAASNGGERIGFANDVDRRGRGTDREQHIRNEIRGHGVGDAVNRGRLMPQGLEQACRRGAVHTFSLSPTTKESREARQHLCTKRKKRSADAQGVRTFPSPVRTGSGSTGVISAAERGTPCHSWSP